MRHPPTPPRYSEGEPSSAPDYRDTRLDAYVQRNLRLALAGILIFALSVAAIGAVFEQEMLAVTQWIAHRLGPGGLLGIVFVSDAVLSPIAPEFVLFVIAHSSLVAHGWLLSLLIGAASWLAGCLGWLAGQRLQHTRVPCWLFGRAQSDNRALFARYGRWAVGLGALTPVPYSLTCWSAGMLGIPLRDVALLGMLRVPRIVLAYGIILHANQLLMDWL